MDSSTAGQLDENQPNMQAAADGYLATGGAADYSARRIRHEYPMARKLPATGVDQPEIPDPALLVNALPAM